MTDTKDNRVTAFSLFPFSFASRIYLSHRCNSSPVHVRAAYNIDIAPPLGSFSYSVFKKEFLVLRLLPIEQLLH